MKRLKILILKHEHIGDYILSLPAIKVLRKNFPRAELNISLRGINKSLAEATPEIDNIILYSDTLSVKGTFPLTNKFFLYLNYLILLLKQIPHLKKIRGFIKARNLENYDIIIWLSQKRVGEIYLTLLKAKKKISGRGFRMKNLNESDILLKVVKQICKNNGKPSVSLKDFDISHKDKKFAGDILKKEKLKDENFVVFHIITESKERAWQGEKWIKIVQFIKKDLPNYKVVFIGSKEDHSKIEKILGNEKIINLAGKTNLIQTMLLIDKAKLFVGLDSGPMHLASLTKTPIVALFEKIKVGNFHPNRKENTFILEKNEIKDISLKDVQTKMGDILNE